MQSRNFFIHLRLILTVFKHKYLKIGDTHEAQYIMIHLECFATRKDLLTEKTSVKFYFARDNGEKFGNKQNQPVKMDSLFTWNALTFFFSYFAYKLSRLSSLNP